jgi:hypothetical protein
MRTGRNKGTITPHLWKSGPDIKAHRYYNKFIQQRNQARFKGQEWTDDDLTFEQWYEFWGEHIVKRGRRKGDYCLTRICDEEKWSINNIKITIRGYAQWGGNDIKIARGY